MSEDNFGFCPKCGASLPADSNYCPECGAILGNVGSTQNAASAPVDKTTEPMSGWFLISTFCLTLYGIVMLISGIYLVIDTPALLDMMNQVYLDAYGMSIYQELSELLGMEITRDYLVQIFTTAGIGAIISAIVALVSAVLCYKRRFYMITLALTVIVMLISIFTGGSLLSLIVGLIVLFGIYSSKPYFID